MKAKRPTLAEVFLHYESIRISKPEPVGDHWECFGVALGDGVWAAPAFVQQPGEMELLAAPGCEMTSRDSIDCNPVSEPYRGAGSRWPSSAQAIDPPLDDDIGLADLAMVGGEVGVERGSGR